MEKLHCQGKSTFVGFSNKKKNKAQGLNQKLAIRHKKNTQTQKNTSEGHLGKNL